ncbi:MAG: DUF3592 domain-containing protein [Oscillospiraceae bacterium]|nr:DUF3592 domain-containing protein [Oscillospiraceae bacterium]
MENKFARFLRNTGPARFFVPLGIILIVVGILLMTHNTDNYLETVGKVTEVQGELNDENSKVYDTSFTYTVDGKEYTGVFEDLSKEYNPGDEIKVFYDPEDPDQITNAKLGGIIAPILIGVGVLAMVFGVFRTVKAFRKSKELDQVPRASAAAFEGFKQTPGVTEYYCRYDGATLKPGYILEDAARKVLFEGKMTKQAMIGARTYSFIDHTTGRTVEHEVGHTVTQTYNDNGWSASSWFKFDGQNVWDLLHARGLRLHTNIRSKFPNVTYEISSGGLPFAVIETSGKYVHEDEAAEHKMNLPIGRFYYRVWTNTRDLETLFLTIFAISETEQMIVE